jgi:hypothetical protein
MHVIVCTPKHKVQYETTMTTNFDDPWSLIHYYLIALWIHFVSHPLFQPNIRP